ncbi:MAG: four-helix bundle copper-binding protein, partial [Pseudobdellovibrionaceae bacterium]
MAARDPRQDSDTAHCIRNCFSTHRVCLETLHYCLTQKRTHFQGRHIALLEMCAEACELAAKAMIADIQFHRQSCVLAFELSLACAEECEKYVEDQE